MKERFCPDDMLLVLIVHEVANIFTSTWITITTLCKIKAINAPKVYKRLRVSLVPMQRYWISNHRVNRNIQATLRLNNNLWRFVAEPVSTFRFLRSYLISANDIVIKTIQKINVRLKTRQACTTDFEGIDSFCFRKNNGQSSRGKLIVS